MMAPNGSKSFFSTGIPPAASSPIQYKPTPVFPLHNRFGRLSTTRSRPKHSQHFVALAAAEPADNQVVQPCVWTWTEHLLQGDSNDTSISMAQEACMEKKHQKLKEEVRIMLMEYSDNNIPLEHRLGLIDSVQRLSVCYHFESEIGNILQNVYQQDEYLRCDDLYTTALSFRLLRSEGFSIPAGAGIFSKFVDERGRFKVQLSSDIQGMLALYEASYMYIYGEEILEQAQTFTALNLELSLPKLKIQKSLHWLESQVRHALHRPLERNSPRIEAKQYIPIYKERGMPYGQALLQFAALDYNILQSLYCQEIKTLAKWRSELGTVKKLPFVRHALVELYIWSMFLYFDPKHRTARIMITKTMYVMTFMDDIYDTHGTLDDLKLFTDAITRMDNASIAKLPEYMQTIVFALQNVYDEIEELTEGRPYILGYVKQEYAKLAQAYEVDAKWLRTMSVPSIKEYSDITFVTGGLTILPALYFAFMGDDATKEVFEWTCDDPVSSFIKASAVIFRMQDDLTLGANESMSTTLGFKTYMKELGVSEEAARAVAREKIKDAFKEMNKGLLQGANSDTANIPRAVLRCLINHAKASDFFNRDEDMFDPRRLKAVVSSLLLEPVVLDEEE